MLVTVPLLFLLVDYWPLGRVAFAEKLPMLFLAAVASVLTAIGTKRMGAMEWAAGIPFGLRVSNALVAYVRYIGKTLWPGKLAIFYPYPAWISAWKVAGAVLLLGSITAAALWRDGGTGTSPRDGCGSWWGWFRRSGSCRWGSSRWRTGSPTFR